jgi:hypothetical protein
MAMTAKQAKTTSIAIPALCVGASLCITVTPFIGVFQQQAGEAERSRQMSAIAKDSIANRCLTYDPTVKGTLKKGAIITGQTPQSLTTSCLYLNGSWGFLAVQEGNVKVMQVYTDREINATKSQFNPIQGN